MHDDDLALALRLADAADRITMAHFGQVDLAVSEKADHTPVSEADQATERAIRELLHAERPGDSILGEEYGTEQGFADSMISTGSIRRVSTAAHGAPRARPVRCSTDESVRQWIIDPIDGTKNYVRGVPVWATLIGLADGDEVVMGVVSAPALGRRWWAAKGQGAWLSINGADPKQIRVSNIGSLNDASISYASLGGWGEKLPQFLELLNQAYRTRAYGDFWSYMLVAEGAVDLAAEPELETYDMAALVPIVTEAGGTFTSLNGQPGPWGGNAIASNTILHDAARAALA